MEGMANKVALIVGATSGIGYATTLLFSENKIKIIAAGRNQAKGQQLVDEINQKNGEAIFVPTDITNPKSIENLVKVAKNEYGGIDFAFNNAGIEGLPQQIIDIEEENWDQVLNTNLKGIWLCLKYEVPAMLTRGGGAIVNTSSVLTKLGLPETGAYTASKAGVDALTQVAAVELGKKGIRVNSINPGAVYTPMLERIYSQDEVKELQNSNPLEKIASPRDIAQTVLWLCSPMASHINGTSIFIDGGAVLNC